MRTHYSLLGMVLAAALVSVVAVSHADKPAEPANSEGVRDVFLLLDRGPLHLRLHITIAGKSPQAVRRDYLKRLMAAAPTPPPETPDAPDPDFLDTLGVTEDRITTEVDVRKFTDAKRAAMAAHASQIGETSFFLTMPEDVFREGFGVEWFILRGAPPGTRESDLLEGL